MIDNDKYLLLDSFRQYAFNEFGEFVSDYIIKDFMKKQTHGGKRKGAGRPPGQVKEPTVVIRVPVSKLAEIKKILKK